MKNKMEKVPFTFSMDFPIFEFPEITFLPLAVKDLTLGGAEFTFSFQLKNPNPYDLLIKDLQVKLHLGDRVFMKDHSGATRLWSRVELEPFNSR